MNITFTHSVFFWGFTSLLIPVAIHLLNRSRGTTIWVGNIKWIKEFEETRSRSIRLNELALLVLRCLVLALMVLILSGPVIQKESSQKKGNLVLIEPGVEELPVVKSILDSLETESLEIRYLTRESISIHSTPPRYNYRNSLAILREVSDSRQWSIVTVFTHGYLRDFHGAMPSLSFDLNWIQLPIDNPAPVSLLSKKYAEDSLMEVSQFLEGNNLLTQKRFVKLASQVDDNDVVHNPRSAAIVSQDTNSPEVKNWLRILKSLERQPGLDFRVTGVLKPDEIHSDSLKPDWMIWIGHAGFNTFNDLSCGVIYYNEPNADNSDNFIRIKSKGSNVYEVTGELSPLSIYEEEFLRELFDIIFKNEVSAEKLMKTDYRQITQIPGKGFISESATYIQKDFSYPFWIAFFIFLFLERYISLKRNQ